MGMRANIGLIILTTIMIIGLSFGEQIYSEGIPREEFKTTINENLTWPGLNYTRGNDTYMSNMIYTFADASGIILFDMCRWSAEYGYDNAEKINMVVIINLFKWFLIIMIIAYLAMPTLYIFAFLYAIYTWAKHRITTFK